MDKFYWGLSPNSGNWELFDADQGFSATPASTGYDDVQGPYDTREEAEENDPND
jgi:hypothetical protein